MTRRKSLLLIAAALLALATLAAIAWVAQQQRQARAQAAVDDLARERGRQLFQSGDGLAGRMAGHDAALPALATRCANCHGIAGQASGPGAAGPSLGRARLADLRARRGGPPSRFDAGSLCRLLNTGRDPADVVIAVTMPRYSASTAQCRDLWAHLTSGP
jgi:cytochrome c553